MLCTYCGLPTDGGANHGSTESCITALLEETQRLKNGVRELRERSNEQDAMRHAARDPVRHERASDVRLTVTPDADCA